MFKKIFYTIISIILLVFLALFSLPMFVHVSPLKEKIVLAVNETIKEGVGEKYIGNRPNFQINGEIKLKSLPLPYINISNISFSNFRYNDIVLNGEIANLNLKVSLIPLLSGKIIIKDVTSLNSKYYISKFFESIQKEEAKVEVETKEITESDLLPDNIDLIENKDILESTQENTEVANTIETQEADKKIEEEKNDTKVVEDLFIKIIENIILSLNETPVENKNINLIFKNDFLSIKYLDIANEFSEVNLNVNINNKINITGSAVSKKQKININTNIENKKGIINGKTTIDSQFLKLDSTHSGKYSEDNIELKTQGNLTIYNLQLFSRWFFKESSWQYNRIISSEKLTTDFSFDYKDKKLNIEKLNLDSPSLKVLIDGNLLAQENNNLNIKISSINFDNFLTKGFASKKALKVDEEKIFDEVDEDKKELYLTINDNTFLSQILMKYNTNINITGDEFIYQKQKIDSLDATLNLKESKFLYINNFKIKLPGESILSLNNENEILKLSIEGNSLEKLLSITKSSYTQPLTENNEHFNFNANLFFGKKGAGLENAELNIEEMKANGSVKIMMNKGIDYLVFQAKINKFVMEKYFKNGLPSFINGRSLKENLLWLNTFNINTFWNLDIDEFAYNDFKENNYKIKLRYGQGYLKTYDMELNIPNLAKISGDLSFNIAARNPQVNGDLVLNNVNFDKINRIINTEKKPAIVLPEIKAEEITEENTTAENTTDKNPSTVDENISEEKKEQIVRESFFKILFKLPNIDDFSGKLNLKADTIKLFNKDIVKDFELVALLNNGRLEINTGKLSIFEGDCSFDGYLEIKSARKISISIKSCTAQSKSILSTVFDNDIDVNGLIGYAGLAQGSGISFDLFKMNYELRLQFNSLLLDVNKFGLKELMLTSLRSYKDVMETDIPTLENILYKKEEITTFNQMVGLLQLNNLNTAAFKFDLGGVGLSGNINGNLLFKDNKKLIEMISTFNIISGTKKKQIPLTLVINTKGDFPTDISNATNLTQVKEYLDLTQKMLKEQLEEIEKEKKEEEEKLRQAEEARKAAEEAMMQEIVNGNSQTN